jgi:hypothetical protein
MALLRFLANADSAQGGNVGLESLRNGTPQLALSFRGELRNLEGFAAFYASSAGGAGNGRGEPLTATAVRAGGVGNGKGEPLKATVVRAGGVGKGRGEPLTARAVRAGGVGNGRGDPLKATVVRAGGVGNGSWEPLRRVLETATMRLLDNCLTELLTGSTIKTAKTTKTRRRKMFFFMAESLLAATMK